MNQKLFTPAYFTIMVMNFMLFLGFNAINPTLPIYFKEIGISETLTGICISIFTVGSILVRPFAGGILDKYGRRVVFFISMPLMILMVYAHAYLTAIAAILLLRLIHGIDWGFVSTGTHTMATDVIPREKLGQGMGIFGLSASLALAVSPAMGVALINHYGFKAMITVCALFMLGTFILGFFYPYSCYKVPPKQQTSEKKKLRKEDLYEPASVVPAVLMGLVTLTMAALTTYVSLYAGEVGLTNAGFFFTAYAVGIIIVRLFVGSLMDRHGIVATMLPAFASMFIAILMLAFAPNGTVLLASGVFYGLGFGTAQTAIQSWTVMNVPQERFGAANGTYFIGFDLGIGLGTILGGWLIDVVGFRPMYLSMAVFVIIAVAILLKFPPRKLENI